MCIQREDCIDYDIVVDSNSKELLCPYSVVAPCTCTRGKVIGLYVCCQDESYHRLTCVSCKCNIAQQSPGLVFLEIEDQRLQLNGFQPHLHVLEMCDKCDKAVKQGKKTGLVLLQIEESVHQRNGFVLVMPVNHTYRCFFLMLNAHVHKWCILSIYSFYVSSYMDHRREQKSSLKVC